MILPVWVVMSQWTLLFALSLLIILMYRQLGFLLHLKDAGTQHDGLAIGEHAPFFDYQPAFALADTQAQFDPAGAWSFLVFADPGCSSCQGTLPALEHLIETFSLPLRALVVTSAEFRLLEVVETFRTASVTIAHVSRQVPDELYRTHATPFAYLIDPSGLVQGKGIATDEQAMHKILQNVPQSAFSLSAPAR